jgi:hypothetical protein
MLSFFRKYEKTFFLVVFAPAVLSLGISGVMVSSMKSWGSTNEQYRIFFKDVTQNDLGLTGARERIDLTLTRYAWEKRSGDFKVQVSDLELADFVKQSVNREMLQVKATEALKARGLKPNTQEWQRAYWSEYFKQMQNKGLTKEDYTKFLKLYGTTEQAYEAGVRTQLRSNRLISAAEDLVSVTPDQLWSAYQEEYHRRAFNVLTIHGKDHVPTKDTVTDKELEGHFAKNRMNYVIPARATLHYLKYSFADAKKGMKDPLKAELEAFYKANLGFYNDSTGKPKAFAIVIADVKKDLINDRLQGKILDAMEKAHDKIRAKNQVADMAAIGKSTAMTYAVTKQLSLDELKEKHKDLAGEPLTVWFNKSLTHRPSAPLMGEDAAFIFWLRDRKPVDFSTFKKQREAVMADYLNLPERDVKKHFEANRTKYRSDEEFKVETLVVRRERVAKKLADPDDGDLTDWFNSHKDEFKDKKLEDVKKEVVKAYKLDKSEEAANEMISIIEGKIAKLKKLKKSVLLEDFAVDRDIPNYRALDIEEWTVSRLAMRDNDILKDVSTQVTSQKIGEPSKVQNLPKDAGKFIFLVREKVSAKVPEFKDVKAKVRKDIIDTRGYERAKEYVEKLLKELDGLRGGDLAKALKSRKLAAKSSALFSKKDDKVEGYKDASRYITETFNLDANGAYGGKILNDNTNSIDLIRCSKREDAPSDEFSAKRAELRKTALNSVRFGLRGKWSRKFEQDARSISLDHMNYARKLFNNDKNITKLKFRQLVFKPDQATLDKWLRAEALKVLSEVQKVLKEGEEFEKVALSLSEESKTRANNGLVGDKRRGDLVSEYGPKFEEKVFELKVGVLSDPIYSKVGVHIVKILKDKLPGGRRRVAHIVVRTSVDYRELPASVLAEAKAVTRKEIDAVAKRLETESFSKILKEYEDKDEMLSYERGDELELSYPSPFQIATSHIGANEVPEAFEFGGEWHLVLVADDTGNAGRNPNKDLRYLAQYHAAFKGSGGQAKAKTVREALIRFQQNYTSSGENVEAPWNEVIKEFKKLVRAKSEAVTKKKGGVLGTFTLDKRVIPYGKAWMKKLSELALKEKGPSRMSGVFESSYGFHILKVVDVTTPKPVDVDPFAGFEASVIRNCDWK